MGRHHLDDVTRNATEDGSLPGYLPSGTVTVTLGASTVRVSRRVADHPFTWEIVNARIRKDSRRRAARRVSGEQ